MSIPFLDVGAGHAELRAELQAAYDRVLDSGLFILGAELESFEHEFASFCGTAHAIGVGNGLDALTITLRARGIGAGDEVIVPAHTFVATWLAVVECGARVVPVDADPVTMLIDTEAVAAAVTPRTAAILPVHLYGCPVDMDGLGALARSRKIALVGDAAQSHGATADGRSTGAMGDAATFSFYPGEEPRRARRWRGDHDPRRWACRSCAPPAQLRGEGAVRLRRARSELAPRPRQAAFLRAKLAVLPAWNARRARIASRYLDELSDVPALVLPARPRTGIVHAWHIFCVRHPRRDAMRAALAEHGIQTEVHYPVPPHRSDAFASLGLSTGAFPVSEAVAATAASLPIGPHLDDDAVTSVIEAVRAFSERDASHSQRS